MPDIVRENSELGPNSTGRWRITTLGSVHDWDLDTMTFVRHHRAGDNPFPFDGKPGLIDQIILWPKVGQVFYIIHSEHRQQMRPGTLQSSIIRSIERIED